MSLSRPSVGSRKSEVLSLRNMQDITETVRGVRYSSLPDQNNFRSEVQTARNSRILIHNDSGQDLERYQAVQVSDTYPNLSASQIFAIPTPESIALVHESSPIQHYGNPVVCDQAIPVGRIGWGTYRGIAFCRVYMPTNAKPFRRLDLDFTAVTPFLRADPRGSAYLLQPWTAIDNATARAAIFLGSPVDVTYAGVAVSDIQPDTSGNVSIWYRDSFGVMVDSSFTVPAELDWMHGDEKVSSGKQVVIKWFQNDQVWRVIGAECEASDASIASSTVTPDTAQTLTSAYAAPAGMAQSFQKGDAQVTGANNNVLAVTEPGVYNVETGFAAEAQANNTEMSYQFVMLNSSNTVGPVYRGRTSGDIISASGNKFYDITQTDLDNSATPGTLSIAVEYNSGGNASADVIWKNNNISIERVG